MIVQCFTLSEHFANVAKSIGLSILVCVNVDLLFVSESLSFRINMVIV